jgi:hypothetical protein
MEPAIAAAAYFVNIWIPPHQKIDGDRTVGRAPGSRMCAQFRMCDAMKNRELRADQHGPRASIARHARAFQAAIGRRSALSSKIAIASKR